MARLRLAAISVFLFVFLVIAPPPVGAGGPDKDKDKTVGPGCDPTRTAVAYHAGGPALKSHEGDLPIPCAVVAGSSMETATVGITSEGTLFYAPQSTGAAVPPAVFRSDDDGATWHQKTPTLQPGTGSAIPWMHVDPETNRIWFAMIGPMPSNCPTKDPAEFPNASSHTLAQITWSDDEGATWHEPPGDPGDCRQLQGGMSVAEGPAPKGQPQPVGYPHVVYHCGNIVDGAVPLSVHCWKSLDGGQTWSRFEAPGQNVPPPSDCTAGKYGGRGRAVGPDGTLYMSVQCPPATPPGSGPLYLASSRDEGNTWDYQFVVNTSYETTEELLVSSLAVDKAGNLYITWVDSDNHPMLIVGKGSGKGPKWGSPLNIAEPGVNFVTRDSVAVNEPGHVAVAYVGSTGGMSGTFNGYIAESKDALGGDPTFFGASVNDPAEPLMSSAYADAITADQGRIWLLTDVFGPDGTPWAAFHCANVTTGMTTGKPTSITCPNGAPAPAAAPLALGVVGRLASHHDDHGDH
jgi:hypothetical protein